ncbi:MAG: hypothetical protein M1450_04405 [Patescibacteria group bacterium]|nr:hypothetical protein [Patescibacteria group bacterium]
MEDSAHKELPLDPARKEPRYENRNLLMRGIYVLRKMRTKVNQERDAKYLFSAYDLASHMADFILSNRIDQADSDRQTLEEEVNHYSAQFPDEEDSIYSLAPSASVSNLYKVADTYRAKIDELTKFPQMTQEERIRFISQRYFIVDNGLAQPELGHLTSKYSRFISPLSGGLIATLMWSKIVERVTQGAVRPIVLGAAIDSRNNKAYIQSDRSTTSEDRIPFVYVLDDIYVSGKTRNILFKKVKEEYPNTKIYKGEHEMTRLGKPPSQEELRFSELMAEKERQANSNS